MNEIIPVVYQCRTILKSNFGDLSCLVYL